jgi:hypothetical protein
MQNMKSRFRGMRARTAALLLLAAVPLGYLGVRTAVACACGDQCPCGGHCDCGHG